MTRVVVAGLGDTGVLVAGHLARRGLDVVGIGTKPGLVSGQELGVRLARPQEWARDYRLAHDRLRRLDPVRVVHGEVTGLDVGARTVAVRLPDGSTTAEPFDQLVVATGVRNGFWRRPDLQDDAAVDADLAEPHRRLAQARSIAVVGGGAAAVSAAANLAAALPETLVDLWFPGERALPHHHPRVWTQVAALLARRGVGLHPGHRAVLPERLDELGAGPLRFATGQPDADADVVLWAVGRVEPNTGWLPADLLDEHGFVVVDAHLRVPGVEGVWAVGDLAATDPLRGSARNRADLLLARNVRRALAGEPLQAYRPARRRWGSVLGVQANGLTVHTPGGRGIRIPAPVVHRVLQPLVVRRGIYGGVRPPG